jgi:gamma-glutamyl-gamma-aminobutyrate hydrolase PuuD
MIGITSEMTAVSWGDRVREAALLPASWARAVQRAGCLPVVLAPWPWHASRLVGRLDGLLFADGAADAGPGVAHPPPGPAGQAGQARDSADLALMRAAIEAGLPVLAIGRGLQVLNLARDGSVREVPADQGGSVPAPSARELRISPGSTLGRLLGPRLTVPAADAADGGQKLGRLGRGLTAVAWAGDEVIEAVELTGHPFTIGLRWHPGESDGAGLFKGFGAAAAVRAAGRGALDGPDRSDGAGATEGTGATPGPERAESTEAAEGTAAAEGTGGAESTRQGTQVRKAKAGTSTT